MCLSLGRPVVSRARLASKAGGWWHCSWSWGGRCDIRLHWITCWVIQLPDFTWCELLSVGHEKANYIIDLHWDRGRFIQCWCDSAYSSWDTFLALCIISSLHIVTRNQKSLQDLGQPNTKFPHVDAAAPTQSLLHPVGEFQLLEVIHPFALG